MSICGVIGHGSRRSRPMIRCLFVGLDPLPPGMTCDDGRWPAPTLDDPCHPAIATRPIAGEGFDRGIGSILKGSPRKNASVWPRKNGGWGNVAIKAAPPDFPLPALQWGEG